MSKVKEWSSPTANGYEFIDEKELQDLQFKAEFYSWLESGQFSKGGNHHPEIFEELINDFLRYTTE